jgi:sulfite reductase (NADPH) flavoprotein alpha-component
LTESIEITQISKPLVQYLASQLNNDQLNTLSSSHQAFVDYCDKHQLIDLLQQFDAERTIPLANVLNQLKAITPRLYSIASAQTLYEDEVHLTINLDDATEAGDYGLVSGLLCHEAKVGDVVKVYVEPNQHFKLPEDTNTAIVMIGAGTGIAPYRAFLQQRIEQQATGENWLLFGNPNFSSDFLYQAEWLKRQQQGYLKHIDVAFSRDQAEKIYVQHKLKAQAEKIWQWLQAGAYLYVCGDANQMAKDVEQTLIEIIAEQGQMSVDDAKNHIKQLKRTQQYQKDVY